MITDFFNSTATIETPTHTKNNMGGAMRSWSVLIEEMPCRIRRLSADEQIVYGKPTVRRDHRLYAEATTTNKQMKSQHRITIGSRTFQIVDVNNVDTLDRHLEIDLLEVE